MKSPVCWGFILILLVSSAYAQESTDDLAIEVEDLYMEKTNDPGLHLFIRKKPNISSVLLTESTKDPLFRQDTYAYYASEWNPINGDELRVHSADAGTWFLVDSSPELHPSLGEAFHIYIPLEVSYGREGTRQGSVRLLEGAYINIRTFRLPYADYSNGFRDNSFVLEVSELFVPAEEEEPVEEEEEEPVEEEKEEEEEEPVEEEKEEEEEPVEEEKEEEEEPVEEEKEEEELDPFVLTPIIYTALGFRLFLPGPEGFLSPILQLKDEYNFIGGLSVSQHINKNLGFSVQILKEPFLENRIIARLSWDIDVIGLEAGAYFGFLNGDSINMNPGLSLVLKVRPPQWRLSGRFQLDSGFGEDKNGPGDFTLSHTSAAFNYDFSWVRLTLSMLERISDFQDEQYLTRIGTWTRYELALEAAPLHTFFGFRLNVGYQRLMWRYYTLDPLVYNYFDIYAGFQGAFNVVPDFLTIFAGVEVPLYPFAYPYIESLDDPQRAFLAKATLTARWTPGRRHKVVPKEQERRERETYFFRTWW